MKGKEFNSIVHYRSETPNGSEVMVSLGKLTKVDETEELAVATIIKDCNGESVAEYCLTQDTFGVYMELLMLCFQHVPTMNKDDADAP